MTDHEKIQELIRLKDQAPISIDPAKCALLVVDTHRYFARPDYPFAQVFESLVPGATEGYFERVKSTVLPNIKRLQERFRARGLPVMFVSFGSYLEDARERKRW